MPADIHALEIEFAKNPTLEACIPLCEAYITQKRFMEAMVVCKKGMKDSPKDGRGRVQLAKVFAGQGKLPKAQQEVEAFLQEVPGNPLGLEYLGYLLMSQGKRDEGVAMLQQALAQNPALVDARAWLQQAGVAVSAAPAAAPRAAAPQQGAPQGYAPQQQPYAQQGYPQQQQGYPQQQQGYPQQQQGYPQQQQGYPQQQQGYPQQQQGYPQQGFAQPGRAAPGMPGAAQGGRPAAPPPHFGQQQHGGMPPSVAHQHAAHEPAAEPSRPLEHVSDFFAPETLGFSSDGGDIETAGPGRLTILGFVPKNTGSIKTTVFVALAVVAVAGAVIFWQYKSSQEQREINKKYGNLKLAMDEDKYGRYREAIRIGETILKIDAKHNLTLGALSYASAALGVDYRDADALAHAKDYLRRAEAAHKDVTEYRVAAKALIAFSDRAFDQGIVDIKKVLDKGGSSPLVELEAFRLMNEAKPLDQETSRQRLRLIQSVTSQARIYNFLGWYNYDLNNYTDADKYFAQALQNVKTHPRALVGQTLNDLDRGIALRERQVEIEKQIKMALSLPAEDLGERDVALAQFARGQLLQWQDKMPEADAAYAIAYKLDPDNFMFYYRRGTQLLSLGQAAGAVDFLRKAAAKQPNNVRVYKTLAEAQIKSGDTAGAKATLDRASQLAPNDKDFVVLNGDRLRAEKKWLDAIEVYKKVPREQDGLQIPLIYTHAQLGISATLRESGKKPESVKFMEDFLANAPAGIDPPTESKLWCEFGLNYEAQKNKEQAITCFQAGIEKYTYNPDCHYFLCRVMGKGEEGVQECKTYLALAPRGEYVPDAKKRSGTK